MVRLKLMLGNLKVGILATDGFEAVGLIQSKKALEDEGAVVEVISNHSGSIKSWHAGNWTRVIHVDKSVGKASVDEYDALVLAGGLINVDSLRLDHDIIEFVKKFVKYGKPIAAIGHAASLLIETGSVQHHMVTSWPTLKTDLINAGAIWVDRPVVSDHGWVTTRTPGDIDEFKRKMIEEFYEGSQFESLSPSQY